MCHAGTPDGVYGLVGTSANDGAGVANVAVKIVVDEEIDGWPGCGAGCGGEGTVLCRGKRRESCCQGSANLENRNHCYSKRNSAGDCCKVGKQVLLGFDRTCLKEKNSHGPSSSSHVLPVLS